MTYRAYTAELRQFGAPAIIIVTSWQTPDEVIQKRNHLDLPFESEDDMMAEALRRASKTECADLRGQLNRIIRLPIIVSPDEAFYFGK